MFLFFWGKFYRANSGGTDWAGQRNVVRETLLLIVEPLENVMSDLAKDPRQNALCTYVSARQNNKTETQVRRTEEQRGKHTCFLQKKKKGL